MKLVKLFCYVVSSLIGALRQGWEKKLTSAKTALGGKDSQKLVGTVNWLIRGGGETLINDVGPSVELYQSLYQVSGIRREVEELRCCRGGLYP